MEATMFEALDISTTGLIAQHTRLNVISDNIANAETILNEKGEYAPYRRRAAILAAGDGMTGSTEGVSVIDIELDQSDFQMRYEPGSPWADEAGYVGYPNVSVVVEQMNALEASRSYEANISAIEASKAMINAALQIIG